MSSPRKIPEASSKGAQTLVSSLEASLLDPRRVASLPSWALLERSDGLMRDLLKQKQLGDPNTQRFCGDSPHSCSVSVVDSLSWNNGSCRLRGPAACAGRAQAVPPARPPCCKLPRICICWARWDARRHSGVPQGVRPRCSPRCALKRLVPLRKLGCVDDMQLLTSILNSGT